MTENRRIAAAQLVVALAFALPIAGCEEKAAPPVAPAPPSLVHPATAPKPIVPAASPTPATVPAAPATSAAVATPFGQSTPEGVACDLARSFITIDSKLFRASCFVITPGSPERDAYNNSIDETATLMDVGSGVPSNNRDWPAAIAQVFLARDLSNPGPAAFGLDQHGLIAVRFVDLRVTLRDKSAVIRRTLVVQDEGSKLWFAVPRPEHFPKLSEGLNGEGESGEVWKR